MTSSPLWLSCRLDCDSHTCATCPRNDSFPHLLHWVTAQLEADVPPYLWGAVTWSTNALRSMNTWFDNSALLRFQSLSIWCFTDSFFLFCVIFSVSRSCCRDIRAWPDTRLFLVSLRAFYGSSIEMDIHSRAGARGSKTVPFITQRRPSYLLSDVTGVTSPQFAFSAANKPWESFLSDRICDSSPSFCSIGNSKCFFLLSFCILVFTVRKAGSDFLQVSGFLHNPLKTSGLYFE